MSEATGVEGAAPPARSLQQFAVLYGGLLVVAGVLGFKLIALGPLAVPGGVFGFLLAIVVTNATAELHGRAVAQRMVLMGFVPLLVSIALMQLVLALPPAAVFTDQAVAEKVFGSSMRLILAGIVAYGVSQTLDVTIFTWMRGQPGGHMLWLRATGGAWTAAEFSDAPVKKVYNSDSPSTDPDWESARIVKRLIFGNLLASFLLGRAWVTRLFLGLEEAPGLFRQPRGSDPHQWAV